MDKEERVSPEDKKHEPYVSTEGDGGVLEVREPTMYYGEVCGGGGSAVADADEGDGEAGEGWNDEWDDDGAFEAECMRLERILWKLQHPGVPMPGFNDADFEAEVERMERRMEENPEEREAYWRECEKDQYKDKEMANIYYTSEELSRQLKQMELEELRREIANARS
ncbi:MAG: hypothetical protein FWC23_05605 [Chitinispirillia bacterium]|nr:hypothetical protein [Chitinispirillia bacterium]MCL2268644.1 hypothetical protein [Chitinispirillia bacterium]